MNGREHPVPCAAATRLPRANHRDVILIRDGLDILQSLVAANAALRYVVRDNNLLLYFYCMKRWLPLWIIPVIVLMAIGTVWLRLTIVRTTYDINQTEKQISNARQEREHIALRLAGLRSPKRLEALAHAKFGLTRPRSEQVVHFK